jgi:hypothetical protein
MLTKHNSFFSSSLPILVVILSLLMWRILDVRLKLNDSTSITQRLQSSKLTCDNPLFGEQLCGKLNPNHAPNQLHQPGRFAKPALNETILTQATGLEATLSLKHWNYVAVSTPQYFIACALVKFSYISDVFLYIIDKKTNEKFEYMGRLPFGIGVHIAPSSQKGCSTWGHPTVNEVDPERPWIEMCANANDKKYSFRANVVFDNNQKLKFDLNLLQQSSSDESLDLLFPLGGSIHRPSYTHKEAGKRVEGWIAFHHDNKEIVDPLTSVGGMDWTKGVMLPKTAWRWVLVLDSKASVKRSSSSSLWPATTTEESVGINLSEDVYDILRNGQPVSAENMIWIGGKIYPFRNPIKIGVPVNATSSNSNNNNDGDTSIWHIRSSVKSQSSADNTDNEFVDITFKPHGKRKDFSDFGVIVSNFIQPYGTFSGTIKVLDDSTGDIITIVLSENAYGVTESHVAIW